MDNSIKEVTPEPPDGAKDANCAQSKSIGELRIDDLSPKSAKVIAKKPSGFPKLGLGIRG